MWGSIKRTFWWLYRRWGQMFCFGVGGFLTATATTRFTDLAILGYAVAGAVFLFTGLGLKALSIWRERGGNPPTRLDPDAL